MMIAASFLFVMLIAVEKSIVQNCMDYRRPLRYVARTVFAFILIMTAISRMYFATHFLHQCIFGALMGASISETLSFTQFTGKLQRMEKQKWFTIGCSMAAVVTSIFWLYKFASGNPMAAVHMVSIFNSYSVTYLFKIFNFRLSNTARILCIQNLRRQ